MKYVPERARCKDAGDATRRRMVWTSVLAAAMTLWVAPRPARAQNKPTASHPTSFARYYGDGLRLYAEGSYEAAVKDLFRAYAVKPSPTLFKLIIRAYDSMGNCSAAQRQRGTFALLYPHESAPGLKVCAHPATLVIHCKRPGTPVRVDGTIPATCGGKIKVPAGPHVVSSATADAPVRVVAHRGKRSVVSLKLRARPWRVARAAAGPRVPRLASSGARGFRIVPTADGLYRIWTPPAQRRRDDLAPLRIQPHVELLCEGGHGQAARRCMLLRRHEDADPDGGADGDSHYEIVIPRVR